MYFVGTLIAACSRRPRILVEIVLRLGDDSTIAVDMHAKANNSIDPFDERFIGPAISMYGEHTTPDATGDDPVPFNF